MRREERSGHLNGYLVCLVSGLSPRELCPVSNNIRKCTYIDECARPRSQQVSCESQFGGERMREVKNTGYVLTRL